MEKRIFHHNKNIYIIEKNIFEPEEIFFERINYIRNNIEKDSYENLIKESNLIINKKNYGCEYISEYSFNVQN